MKYFQLVFQTLIMFANYLKIYFLKTTKNMNILTHLSE